MSVKFNMGLPVKFEGLMSDCRDVIAFFDDFIGTNISATAELGKWLQSTNGGAIGFAGYANASVMDASQELTGGWIALTPEATATDYVNLTVNGPAFQIDQGKPLYFETRVFVPDISDINWWIGLTGSDPDLEIIKGGISDAGIGFECIAAGALSFITAIGGNEKTAITGDTVANVDIWKLAFYYDGVDTITFYTAECSAAGHTGELVEVGTRKLSVSGDYCPEDKMLTPTIEAHCEGTGANDPLCVDYILCVQQRTQTLE